MGLGIVSEVLGRAPFPKRTSGLGIINFKNQSSFGSFHSSMARDTAPRLKPGKKRKRKGRVFDAWKKSRTVGTISPEKDHFQDQAVQLEENILSSRTNYNSIHTLLGYLRNDDGAENERIVATVALCRVFCRLMAGGSLSKLRESSSNELTIIQWLRERLQDYEQGLLRMLRTEDMGTQSTALTVLVRLVKEKASHLNQSEDAIWHDGLFGQLVQTLIAEDVFEEVRNEFVEKYVKKYEDVRFYTCACLTYVRKPH